MIKAIIKPEDWEELERILRKHQVGYTVSYDAHGKDHREMLIAMNPIGVQYYDDNYVNVATGVPKAEWIQESHGHMCSNCNEYANSFDDDYNGDIEFLDQYCSKCGAKMENWDKFIK